MSSALALPGLYIPRREKRVKPENRDNSENQLLRFSTLRVCTLALCLTLVCGFAACTRTNPAAESEAQNVGSYKPVISAPSPAPEPSAPPAFNASRAMQYVKELVAYGPRPLGSE